MLHVVGATKATAFQQALDCKLGKDIENLFCSLSKFLI